MPDNVAAFEGDSTMTNIFPLSAVLSIIFFALDVVFAVLVFFLAVDAFALVVDAFALVFVDYDVLAVFFDAAAEAAFFTFFVPSVLAALSAFTDDTFFSGVGIVITPKS